MKHENRIIVERIYHNCNEEDVTKLMHYWDTHKERGYIDIKIEAEIDECGHPNGTYQCSFSFSVSSVTDKYFHNLGQRANYEMTLFLEGLA